MAEKLGVRKCPQCELRFKPDEEAFVLETSGAQKGRYYHAECYKLVDLERQSEKDLHDFIKSVSGNVSQGDIIRLRKYKKDYGYTFSGMLGTLNYFCNIKHNTLQGIGIIPHIYDEARRYYTKINETEERIDMFDGEVLLVTQLAVKRPPKGKPLKMRKEINMEDL